MDVGTHSERLFKFNLPFKLPSSTVLRAAGVYLSGILYSVGFWFLVDASIYSKTVNASIVHVTFVDWIPGICSSLGMFVVNSIDKNRLFNDSLNGSGGGGLSSFNGGLSSTSWYARLILFFGFSLLAGGLAGSVVVLVLKFLMKDFNTYPTLGMGVANVVCNSCIMLSCIVLWISQNIEDEYSYSLVL
ncbi:Vps68p [Ascoidea rubescens DSM 1968]|uniref:UPF0220-domain-containing protein n=1 Tax=Ascoidea rubescens DSM 1968 TaxID=1344418 RepID=A0A1D2VHI8_9ASCO|nr:UPF0220-domain-containing protein [Ascoidea rubescens DSM 1968]ODV61118.1 UPF0220-domain-containing protein [Ascoidea rubescens DSM 1968]